MFDTRSLFLSGARLRLALAPALAALLVACGGGGGGDDELVVEGPPTAAAALTDSTTTAAESARAAVASAEAAAQSSSSLSGLFPIFDVPLASARPMPQSREQRKRPQLTETVSCGDIFFGSCSGSVRLETNLSGDEQTAPAGSYIDMRFSSLSGGFEGESIQLNGTLRMEFVTAFNLDTEDLSGLNLLVELRSFGGSVNGLDFGPVTAAMRLQFNNQGAIALTVDGRSFSGLSGVDLQGDGNYRIGGGSVRSAYWGDAARYVDVDLSGWNVVNGRPTVGSQATITAGGDSIDVVVTSVTSTTVVYSVAVSVGGSTTFYVVTATYVGSSAPTYQAVAAD